MLASVFLALLAAMPGQRLLYAEKAKYETVISEGMADLGPAGISAASDEAVRDAQHKAVEQVLGRMYSARTVAESGRFIEQTVTTNIKGYIKKWKKLEGPEIIEFQQTEAKVVRVRIEAQVGVDRLREDTLALEEIQNRIGRPDLAVVLDDPDARQAVIEKLTERRFALRDIPEDADILIEGDLEIRESSRSGPTKVYGIETQGRIEFQSKVSLRALLSSSRELIAEYSASGAEWHIEENMARIAAVREAAQKAAEGISDGISMKWEDILNNGTSIFLRAEGLSVDNETAFMHALKRRSRGIKEIYPRGMKQGVFFFKIMYLGRIQTLARELQDLGTGYTVEVQSYDTNSIEVKVID
jgi:hypothetical protein